MELSLPTVVVVAALSSLLLAGALLYVRRAPEPTPGLDWWLAGVCVNALRYFLILHVMANRDPFVVFLIEALQAVSTILIVSGVFLFLGRRIRAAYPLALAALATAWAYFTTLAHPDFMLRSVPLYLLSGGALVAAGAGLWLARGRTPNSGYGITGFLFVLWGLHKMDFPWLRPIEWFAPWGFLIAAMLFLAVSISLIIIVQLRLTDIAQKEAAGRARAETAFKSLFDNSEISIWNMDFSGLYRDLEEFRRDGISDLADHLVAGEDGIVGMIGKIEVVHVNDATLKLFGGGSETDFTGSLWKTIGPAARDVFGKLSIAIWEGERVFRSEARLRTFDGRDIDCIVSLQIPDNVAGFASIPVSLVDITERKRTEAEVSKSELKYRQLFESSRDALMTIFPPDWKFASGNSAALEIFGVENKESFQTFGPIDFSPEYQPDGELSSDKARRMIERAMTEGSAVFEWAHRRLDGETVPTKVLLTRVEINGSVGVQGSVRDISERKHTEAQLMRARDEAENASRAKSEFLASMSHELRTPLNAILGYAQFLSLNPDQPLTSAQKEQVESIRVGGNMLLSLINEILDLSRIEAHQTTLNFETVELADVVEECLTLTRSIAAVRDIGIDDNIKRDIPVRLRTDRLRLKQVLLNLLSNAVKFNREGGRVSIESTGIGNGFQRISVTDTGIGIAEWDQSRVFDVFHRLDSNPMTTTEGTGIGLSVSRLLVERMAGRIGFESEQHVGTTFWVDLPMEKNANVFFWTDDLRTGIDPIDRDHLDVIRIVNRLAFESVDGDDVDLTLDELALRTSRHFRLEEAIMEACDHPEMEEHCMSHQDFERRLAELTDEWNRHRDADTLSRIRHSLQDWLSRHISASETDFWVYATRKELDLQSVMDSLG